MRGVQACRLKVAGCISDMRDTMSDGRRHLHIFRQADPVCPHRLRPQQLLQGLHPTRQQRLQRRHPRLHQPGAGRELGPPRGQPVLGRLADRVPRHHAVDRVRVRRRRRRRPLDGTQLPQQAT